MEQRLAHDLARLSDNLVPTDPATGNPPQNNQIGAELTALSYSIQPVAEEEIKEPQLSDKDVTRLAQSLEQNTAFRGQVHLANNNLTDLVSERCKRQSGLALAKMLERNGQITALDISLNKLTSKTAVFLAQALQIAKSTSLQRLSLAGNPIGAVGVRQVLCIIIRRLMEATASSPQLEVLVFGILEDEAVEELALHLPQNEVIVTLGLQEPENTPWRAETKAKLVKAMSANQSVRLIKIDSEDTELEASLDFFAQRNQKKHESEEAEKERQKKLSADALFDQFLEKSGVAMQELPVRQHLKNSFGPLLKDALFEMRKRQARERKENLETITGGVCFVADYLLDRLPENEKFGLQNEQVEEEELN